MRRWVPVSRSSTMPWWVWVSPRPWKAARMLRAVGRAARPSGRSPWRVASLPTAPRRSVSMSPKTTRASPTTLTRASMRSSLCRKTGRTAASVGVAVAQLDQLVFVEAQQLGGRQPPGQVGGQRVDPVGAGGLADGVLVTPGPQGGRARAGAGGDLQQAAHGRAEELRDLGVDLIAGLVVAAAQATLGLAEGGLCLGQGALTPVGDAAGLLRPRSADSWGARIGGGSTDAFRPGRIRLRDLLRLPSGRHLDGEQATARPRACRVALRRPVADPQRGAAAGRGARRAARPGRHAGPAHRRDQAAPTRRERRWAGDGAGREHAGRWGLPV